MHDATVLRDDARRPASRLRHITSSTDTRDADAGGNDMGFNRSDTTCNSVCDMRCKCGRSPYPHLVDDQSPKEVVLVVADPAAYDIGVLERDGGQPDGAIG